MKRYKNRTVIKKCLKLLIDIYKKQIIVWINMNKILPLVMIIQHLIRKKVFHSIKIP